MNLRAICVASLVVVPSQQLRAQAPPPSSWLQSVSHDIECDEYHFAAVEPDTYSAPNRAHDLRSRIGASGIALFARNEAANEIEHEWMLELRTRAWGCVERMEAVGVPIVASSAERVELVQHEFTEWYVNDDRGIEQGWTIHVPPEGSEHSMLRIELNVWGLATTISADAGSATFVDRNGELRVHYDGLRAWDAKGCDLPARLDACADGLALEVDTRGASYPVTIDPVLAGPTWTAQSGQFAALFGRCVSSAGDINGDGSDDVIVGALYFDGGQADEGRAYVYLGSPSGLSLAPNWFAEINVANAIFGSAVSGAGDVNSDGFDDVIVGAHGVDNGSTVPSSVHVYYGSNSGPSLTPDWSIDTGPSIFAFGCSVSSAGDVDNNGYDDEVVGASLFSGGETHEGRVYFYLSSASGLPSSPSWTAESNQLGAGLGISVSDAGDVNNDGYDDIIAGAYNFDHGQDEEGGAFLYLGSPTGPTASSWLGESNLAEAKMGISVAAAGNVNGDPYDDVIVGAYYYDGAFANAGRAYVYFGSSSGLPANPDWIADGYELDMLFGNSVSGAGDVDADGYDDVIVGTYALSGEGRAFVYLGSASGPSSSPSWTLGDDQANSLFGYSVSNAGDVNADGLDDVIVGAPRFDVTQVDEGRASVYLGAAPCGRWRTYCTAGVTSSGCAATMSASGMMSVSATSGFTLTASNVEGQKQGLLFYGVSGPHNAPWYSGGTSFLCVKAPTQRMPVQNSSGTAGACDGVIATDWLAYLATHPGALGAPFSAGTDVWTQAWIRDPPSPKTTNLSNGLTFTTCP